MSARNIFLALGVAFAVVAVVFGNTAISLAQDPGDGSPCSHGNGHMMMGQHGNGDMECCTMMQDMGNMPSGMMQHGNGDMECCTMMQDMGNMPSGMMQHGNGDMECCTMMQDMGNMPSGMMQHGNGDMECCAMMQEMGHMPSGMMQYGNGDMACCTMMQDMGHMPSGMMQHGNGDMECCAMMQQGEGEMPCPMMQQHETDENQHYNGDMGHGTSSHHDRHESPLTLEHARDLAHTHINQIDPRLSLGNDTVTRNGSICIEVLRGTQRIGHLTVDSHSGDITHSFWHSHFSSGHSSHH